VKVLERTYVVLVHPAVLSIMDFQRLKSVRGLWNYVPHHPLGGVLRFYQLRMLLVELGGLFVSLFRLFSSEIAILRREWVNGRGRETYLK
jgi:hypothetical protein